jgi:hypothetical protein
MNKIVILILLLSTWGTVSCKTNSNPQNTENLSSLPEEEEEENYLSINQYLDKQFEMQQHQNYVLLKVVDKNGTIDSSYVDVNKSFFDTLKEIFGPTDINGTMFKNKYKVATSHDFSNAMIFVQYTALDTDLLTQKAYWSIHDETMKIKSVYIETQKSSFFKSKSTKLNYNTEKSIVIQEYEKAMFSELSTTITKYFYEY